MTAPARPPNPPLPPPAVSTHNTLGLDYAREADRLGPPVVPIIDCHTHIHGSNAARLYDRARRLFGVTRTYSMSQLPMADAVRDALGDSVRFIAMPVWSDPDKESTHRAGYLRTIERFHRDFGSRMMKLWASPRLRDVVPSLKGRPFGATDLAEIDAPARVAHCELAQSLGMMFMVHVADPDTWFATKYTHAPTYGTKRQQYEGLERMLDRFSAPWIAAHMGGWPEDLAFLDGLLTRHPNLHLDTSATKWVVRELSRHEPSRTRAFFTKWSGRILFGTDLVVMEDQLSPSKQTGSPMGDLASSPEQALELYCSRHWALRTMFETAYDGPSPIADPDLAMVDPARFTPMSTPRLRGIALPATELRVLYHDAAANLIERWWAEHP
ncbi:MAG: amidohydrolase family protein [Phycisphaerae bacterium]|nr:amidohydrolase family protein [Phycisphaerae bacterium]